MSAPSTMDCSDGGGRLSNEDMGSNGFGVAEERSWRDGCTLSWAQAAKFSFMAAEMTCVLSGLGEKQELRGGGGSR